MQIGDRGSLTYDAILAMGFTGLLVASTSTYLDWAKFATLQLNNGNQNQLVQSWLEQVTYEQESCGQAVKPKGTLAGDQKMVAGGPLILYAFKDYTVGAVPTPLLESGKKFAGTNVTVERLAFENDPIVLGKASDGKRMAMLRLETSAPDGKGGKMKYTYRKAMYLEIDTSTTLNQNNILKCYTRKPKVITVGSASKKDACIALNGTWEPSEGGKCILPLCEISATKTVWDSATKNVTCDLAELKRHFLGHIGGCTNAFGWGTGSAARGFTDLEYKNRNKGPVQIGCSQYTLKGNVSAPVTFNGGICPPCIYNNGYGANGCKASEISWSVYEDGAWVKKKNFCSPHYDLAKLKKHEAASLQAFIAGGYCPATSFRCGMRAP